MRKINCIIIDDEPLALDLVEGYVNKTPFLELKGKCLSALEALQIMNTEKIDLVFSDIQMPDLNGIDFSKTLSADTKVIFTTAFKEYAFDGFKVDAVDYLLKPFNYQEFLKAANKAQERINKPEEKRSGIAADDFIFVKSEYKQVKINLNEVYYFEGLKDYIKIWISSQPKPILTLMSLKTLEQELPEEKFMRVHRSFIIALGKIESVERSQVVINKERITIAEQYKNKFQEFVENKSFN
ncbi:MAG: response regulator transcription factor [Bacteroidetes bacterium]|nr:response regulator transcription factor [Bacteroidota bacterium]